MLEGPLIVQHLGTGHCSHKRVHREKKLECAVHGAPAAPGPKDFEPSDLVRQSQSAGSISTPRTVLSIMKVPVL